MSDLIPRTVLFDIEISAGCNARCSFCPQNWYGVKRSYPHLTKPLLDKIHQQILWTQTTQQQLYGASDIVLGFCGMGETLLKRDLFYYALEQFPEDVSMALVTNGAYLTEDVLKHPSIHKLKNIYVSLSGWKESYEKVYRLNFDVVIDNLIKAHRSFPDKVSVNLIESPDIEDSDQQKLKAFLDQHAISTEYSKLHSRGGHYQHPEALAGPKRQFSSCEIFKYVIFIASDGKVLSCCHDVMSMNPVGDIATDSVAEIFERKKQLITEKKPFDICKNCTDFTLTGFNPW